MKYFKHILAATDLSPESLSGVSYASHLALAQGAIDQPAFDCAQQRDIGHFGRECGGV